MSFLASVAAAPKHFIYSPNHGSTPAFTPRTPLSPFLRPIDLQLGPHSTGSSSPALQSSPDARQRVLFSPRASRSSTRTGSVAAEPATEADTAQIEALRFSANVSLQDIFSNFAAGGASARRDLQSDFDYSHAHNASTSTVGGGLDPVLDAFPAPRLSRSNSDLSGGVGYPYPEGETSQNPTEPLAYRPTSQAAAAVQRRSNGLAPSSFAASSPSSMSAGPSSDPRESELAASQQPPGTPPGYSHNSTAPITAPRDPAHATSSDALHSAEGARSIEGRLRGRRHSFGPSARPESAQGSIHSGSTSSHPSKPKRLAKDDETLRVLGVFIGTEQQPAKKGGKPGSIVAPSTESKPKKAKRRDFLGLDLSFGSHSASRSSSQKSASRSLVGARRDWAGTTAAGSSPPNDFRSGPASESPPLQYTMGPGPSNISAVARDEGEVCPVCLEPLAMRMRGEKPPVTPICGHGLHSSCFEAVYGPMERARNKGGNLGLCGVCRRDMKLGDDSEGGQMSKTGRSKFAMMAGIPGRDNGSATLDSHKVRSISRRTLATDANAAGQSLHDPAEDDELVDDFTQPMPQYRSLGHRNSADTLQAMGGASSPVRGRSGSASGYASSRGRGGGERAHREPEVAQPRITVISESSTLTRSTDRTKTQHITCMVTVEMPSKYPAQQLPAIQDHVHAPAHRDSASPTLRSGHSQVSHHLPAWPSLVPLPNVDRSPTFEGQRPDSPGHSSGRSSGLLHDHIKVEEQGHGALQGVVDDLRARMHDWKGHDPDTFGRLHLFDFLSVRKNDQSRQFLLYLFEETLLCVDENKRLGPNGQPAEKQLRLRGRVYARHISRVEETSPSPSDLTLTVEMEQKDLDAFVISFTDRSVLEVWREKICQLVERQKAPRSVSAAGRGSIMSENTEHTRVTNSSSEGGYPSSAFTRHTHTTGSSAPPLSSVGEEDEMSYGMAKMSMLRPMAHSRDTYPYNAPNASLGSLGGPRELTPIDLMLILSVPVQLSSAPSSYSLKLRLIRQALDFVINSVGSRARISIVTFSAGDGARAQLRKTPFLAVGREDGRRRLQRVLEEIGRDGDPEGGSSGTLGMIEHAEEKTSVVTAVNLALDILLQRKQKSPLTGVLLMNDARDYSSKSHMSLVMARAEAANVPIHTFGWSKTHDPSSLWQLSHHTGGTYTFVQDWYSLKDCIAGCIGAMLSIAITTFRLHISVPERRWFRIRKVAGINSVILASDGKDADIDVSELRYGEKRELLVEMEMLAPAQMQSERRPAVSTATDEFFLRRTGINPMSMDDLGGNLYDAEFDDLVDEVPLFEVDASYRDPAAGKQVSRLPYPVLLTVTVAPPNPPGVRSPVPPPEPSIVRRRIEILTSDAMTRALLLLSRNNEANARQLLSETRRIIHALMSNLGGDVGHHSPPCSRRGQTAAQTAQDVLSGCAEDLSIMLQGLGNRATFDRLERNFAAQQAVVLREQKAWTGRTATERAYWTSDNSLWFAAQSARYLSGA